MTDRWHVYRVVRLSTGKFSNIISPHWLSEWSTTHSPKWTTVRLWAVEPDEVSMVAIMLILDEGCEPGVEYGAVQSNRGWCMSGSSIVNLSRSSHE